MRPSVKSFINFNPFVGPGQMVILGYPGSGKSVHATSMAIQAVGKGEMGLIHGDITCEWRHFHNYPKYVKKIKIIVPKNVDIEAFNIMKKYDATTWITEDYSTLDVVNYLEPHTITVVYDDCFSSTDKTKLWTKLFAQIVFRKKYHDKTICYVNHEAGITFPQSASKKQWESVDLFSEVFVFFRKTGIRAILLSQIENEIFHRVREKCIWRIYRLAVPGKSSIGRVVRKYAKRMTRDQYHIFYGDLYVPLNSNPKIKEITDIWKMIPPSIIDLKLDSPQESSKRAPNRTLTKIIKKKYDEVGSKRAVAKDLGIDYNTVNRHLGIEA